MSLKEAMYDELKKGPISIHDLAFKLKVDLKVLIPELDELKTHIKPKRILMKSAYCEHCGWQFRERSKYKAPSVCPKCKHEAIESGLLYLN